jgi:hypothetical protein
MTNRLGEQYAFLKSHVPEPFKDESNAHICYRVDLKEQYSDYLQKLVIIFGLSLSLQKLFDMKENYTLQLRLKMTRKRTPPHPFRFGNIAL